MSYDPEPVITKYLQTLDRELRGIPPDRRREVVDEIAEHIAQAREAAPVESEAEIRNLLERIGAPAEIAAEAQERFGGPAHSRWRAVVALILLLLGGFAFVFGWFVGAFLLWTSKIWTTRDKLIGTLILPGGLVFSLLVLTTALVSGQSCESGPQVYDAGAGSFERVATSCNDSGSGTGHVLQGALIGLLLLAPFLTTIYLARRLRTLEPADTGTTTSSTSNASVVWVILAVILILFVFMWLASQTLIPKSHG